VLQPAYPSRSRKTAFGGCLPLHFQAPGFYRKQGYDIVARLEAPPPGATRILMTKKLG